MKVLGSSAAAPARAVGAAAAKRGAQGVAAALTLDEARFLGVPEAELTASVRAAINLLAAELEELRGEVRRLKARLMEAEAAAEEDPLTGVKNRRGFLRELRRAAAFARRHGAVASLLYLDLDGLKGINDRQGHGAGDAALKALAARLLGHVRESDVVGRLGGDEFAVLLLQADADQARAKAESLAQLLEEEPAVFENVLLPLSVSYGVRQLDPGAEPEEALAAADAAMLAMKQARPQGIRRSA